MGRKFSQRLECRLCKFAVHERSYFRVLVVSLEVSVFVQRKLAEQKWDKMVLDAWTEDIQRGMEKKRLIHEERMATEKEKQAQLAAKQEQLTERNMKFRAEYGVFLASND